MKSPRDISLKKPDFIFGKLLSDEFLNIIGQVGEANSLTQMIALDSLYMQPDTLRMKWIFAASQGIE
jgi:hypothetical protein